ncbi:MAG: hypothetical protein CM15mP60_3440 [Alphaproteobacteria bacterium]|nr:MAG: hypothetical protein CM15mP60_3440 [Alphaproteobacteria bacterium]
MKSMDNIPFYPVKENEGGIHVARDIQRRADWYGLPKPKLPAPYPLQEIDQANKVGNVLNQQGRYLEYFEETYRLWFVSGIEAGLGEKNLRLVFNTMQLIMMTSCIKPKMKPSRKNYEANTEEAKKRGFFGAPSFLYGQEFFGGNAPRRCHRVLQPVKTHSIFFIHFGHYLHAIPFLPWAYRCPNHPPFWV